MTLKSTICGSDVGRNLSKGEFTNRKHDCHGPKAFPNLHSKLE